MSVLSRKSTSYAGFLNGYVAGNLSANSDGLNLHTSKIESFVEELYNEIKTWNLNEESTKKFEKCSQEFGKPNNSIDFYFKLGDNILDLVTIVHDLRRPLPTTASFILKKIIYHYLNIAKTSREISVLDKAMEIVTKFEDSDNQ